MVEGLVSVIMPVFNAEKYIKKAIDSILNQTYSFLELIIVEDCSTDSTQKVIEAYNDSRIKKIFNERNHGISYSTNRAITESKGEYLAIMDDDDIATLDRLEKSVNYLKRHPEISLVFGNAIIINENDQLVRAIAPPRHNPKIIKAMLLFRDLIINSTTTMRRSVVYDYNIWYRDDCYGLQDLQFYMEASKVVLFSSVDDVLLYYRSHSESETKKQIGVIPRKEKYAQIQRDSLQKSGFDLCNSDYQIINEIVDERISEKIKRQYSYNDILKLYHVFKKIFIQAKEKKVDYIDELEWVLKKIIGEKLLRTDLFI